VVFIEASSSDGKDEPKAKNLPRTCPPRVVFALSRPGHQREASQTQTPASRDQPPQLRSALVLAVNTSPPYPSEGRHAPLRLRWWMVSLKPKLLIIGRRRRRKKMLSARILCSFLSSPVRSLRRDSFSGAARSGVDHSRAGLTQAWIILGQGSLRRDSFSGAA